MRCNLVHYSSLTKTFRITQIYILYDVVKKILRPHTSLKYFTEFCQINYVNKDNRDPKTTENS